MFLFLEWLHMTIKTFFTAVGQDASLNYEQMLKRQVIDQTAGIFDPLREEYYQSNIATPLTCYQSKEAFVKHSKDLAISIIMAIPNLILGVLSVAYYALAGLVILAAKLLTLPFKVLLSGLFSNDESGSLSAMAKSLEGASKGMIGTLIKWSLGMANALLTTIKDVALMPVLLATTTVTKSTATLVATIGDFFYACIEYCTSPTEEEPHTNCPNIK